MSLFTMIKYLMTCAVISFGITLLYCYLFGHCPLLGNLIIGGISAFIAWPSCGFRFG
jgi:hypothetical protein